MYKCIYLCKININCFIIIISKIYKIILKNEKKKGKNILTISQFSFKSFHTFIIGIFFKSSLFSKLCLTYFRYIRLND